MRVCLLSKMYPPATGGAETYAYELSNALGRRGHDVDVYTQSVETDDETPTLDSRVSVTWIAPTRKFLGPVETLIYSGRARRVVDWGRYDVVHGTLMPASTVALTPGRRMADVPVVVTSHGTSLDEVLANDPETAGDYALKYLFHPGDVVLDAVAGRVADRVLAISDHARRRLVGTYGLTASAVETVPHGVDVERFRPRAAVHPAVSPNRTSILTVGRLGPRKGVDLGLRTLASLGRSDVEYLVAGSGRHERSLRQLARRLGVDDRVTFLGHVPDEALPLLYSSADIFLLPSRYEGFGLVLLEAMACRTPVLGTAVGGIPDVVAHGETGYLVPRRPTAIAGSVEQLLDDDRRERMADAARDRAKAFSWDRVAATVEAIYQDVTG